MDGGAGYAIHAVYANDMERVQGVVQGQQLRGQMGAPTWSLNLGRTIKFMSGVSFGGPMKPPAVGERVMIQSLVFKSPEHLEALVKANPGGWLRGGSFLHAEE